MPSTPVPPDMRINYSGCCNFRSSSLGGWAAPEGRVRRNHQQRI